MEVLLTLPNGNAETIKVPDHLHADLVTRYGNDFNKHPWAMVEVLCAELARLNDQLNAVAEEQKA